MVGWKRLEKTREKREKEAAERERGGEERECVYVVRETESVCVREKKERSVW